MSARPERPAPPPDGRPQSRIVALDALRGLLMVLMALDHTSYFVAKAHSPGEYWGGPFPSYDRALPFLVRLVTHPAAPGFAFLMGASMVLFAASRRRSGWSSLSIAKHFLIRGALLIALQFLVVNVAWRLVSPSASAAPYAGVLFALGSGMIVAAPLVRLRPVCLLALGIALATAVVASTPDSSQWSQPQPQVVRLLLVPGGDDTLWVNYPVLPWLGLTLAGMAFGGWLRDDRARASSWTLPVGLACLAAFGAVRIVNGFGNLRAWDGGSWIDFLNVVKYPPSIAFALLAMGANLVALGALFRAPGVMRWILHPLIVFGRTPLLFYVTHLFLYAGLGWALAPRGTSIPAMLPVWLLGLAILYPLCRLFGRIKASSPPKSVLRYV
jgi:uncharacterized membrane protein